MAEEATTSLPPPAASAREATPDKQATDLADAAVSGTSAAAQEPKDGANAESAPETNGEVDAAPSSAPSGEATTTAPADTDMPDAGDAGAADGAAADPATPAPASGKKAANGSTAKKRSAGVPEHKQRKLSKKKSKATLHMDAQPGDYFLARMKGHPPWPSVVCEEDMLPGVLLSSRPVTAALPDGSYKKPEYADGGKRANERTFPVMFLYTNEFAWMPNTDLTPLTPEMCKEVSDKNKAKSLLEAYKIAAGGHELPYFKDILIEHQEQIQEAETRKRQAAETKAASARRKSDAAAKKAKAAAADEMDLDDDEEEEKPKSKKRKKAAAESDDESEKPAKTPKTGGTKLKLTTPKTPAAESTGKKKAPKPKALSKKAKAPANGSDDEEMVDTPMVEEKPLSEAELKDKKEKEIRYYRHRLQRGFLSRDTAPSDEEVDNLSTYLAKLENYPELEASIIRATKIHKVLKAMIRLPSIPKDEKHHFKPRSVDLLGKWNQVLANDPSGAGDKDDDGPSTATKADDKAEGEKPAAGAADAAADKPETNGVQAAEDKPAKAKTLVQETGEASEAPVLATKPAEEPTAEKAAEDKPAVEPTAMETDEPTADAPAAQAEPVEATA